MDITKFCATDDGRFPLSKPWVKDGWRYAMDAEIAAREPTTDADSESMYGARNLAELSERTAALFGPPLSRAARDVLAVVPTHDGKDTKGTRPACMAVENPTKETCSKVGFCTADGAWDCTADGEDECPNMVDHRIPADQHFADHKWQGQYIELLNEQLPDAQYMIAKGLMYFFSGDVEGILAPMKG